MKNTTKFALVAMALGLALAGCSEKEEVDVKDAPKVEKEVKDEKKNEEVKDKEVKEDNVQEDTKSDDKKDEDTVKVFDYSDVSFLPENHTKLTFKDYDNNSEFSKTFTVEEHTDKFDNEMLMEYSNVEYTNYVFEDEKGFYTSHGMEYSTSVQFPVEKGATWLGYGEGPKHVIEEVNVTVETPFKTFDNAVKVSVETKEGYVDYFVPGIGLVKVEKMENNEVKTVIELTNME